MRTFKRDLWDFTSKTSAWCGESRSLITYLSEAFKALLAACFMNKIQRKYVVTGSALTSNRRTTGEGSIYWEDALRKSVPYFLSALGALLVICSTHPENVLPTHRRHLFLFGFLLWLTFYQNQLFIHFSPLNHCLWLAEFVSGFQSSCSRSQFSCISFTLFTPPTSLSLSRSLFQLLSPVQIWEFQIKYTQNLNQQATKSHIKVHYAPFRSQMWVAISVMWSNYFRS